MRNGQPVQSSSKPGIADRMISSFMGGDPIGSAVSGVAGAGEALMDEESEAERAQRKLAEEELKYQRMVKTGSAVPDEMSANAYFGPVGGGVAYLVDQGLKGKEPEWDEFMHAVVPTPSQAQVEMNQNATALKQSWLSGLIGLALMPFALKAGERFLNRRGLLDNGGGTNG